MAFPTQMHKGPKLTFALKGQMSTLDQHFKEFYSTRVPNAAYQVSRSPAVLFLRRFFRGFTINGHDGHLGHVTMIF